MNIFDLVKGQKRPLVLSEIVVIEAENNKQKGKSLITVDATMEFKLSQGLTLTEHPVEKGANTSDHAQVKLKEIAVAGIITEAPLTIYSGFASVGLGALGGAIGGTAGAIATGMGSKLTDTFMGVGEERVGKAKAILDSIVNEKKLINITIKNHAYSNFMMSDLVYTDTVDTGNSLSFTATLKEMRITIGKTSSNQIGDKSISKSAVEKSDKGIKQTKDLSEDKLSKWGGSILSRFWP